MINTPQKAYWLGFIWADGYVGKRERKNQNRIEYNLKIDIVESDKSHLEKFNNDIKGSYPIHTYTMKGFNTINKIVRINITSKIMCKFLYEELGVIPYRYDATKVINHIPPVYHKYFILGLLDGDGSFSKYIHKNYGKANLSFGGSCELLKFIENHLDQNVLHNGSTHNFYQRNKGRDGTWRSLCYSGVPQVTKILKYLYDSPIYLNRKFIKANELFIKTN